MYLIFKSFSPYLLPYPSSPYGIALMFAHLHVHLDMLNIYFYYDMRTDVSKESLIALLCNLNEM